jgi:uncharacterized protein YegL
MKRNLTQIVFILDNSGSMANLTGDTIGGYNAFIDEQKKAEGEAILTTVLFNTNYSILHNAVNIKEVEPLTTKDYIAGGGTALLDAIGRTIAEVQKKIDDMDEEKRPARTIFVITTDGEENSSREYKQPQVKSMIEHQNKGHGWEFIFLGANIDAVSTAQDYGIAYASSYSANARGLDSVYTGMSKVVTSYRGVGGCGAGGAGGNGVIPDDWNKDIK